MTQTLELVCAVMAVAQVPKLVFVPGSRARSLPSGTIEIGRELVSRIARKSVLRGAVVVWVVILAHEIAHMSLAHGVCVPKDCAGQELHADWIAGRAAALLGVPLEMALRAFDFFSDLSPTHPAVSLRRATLERGYAGR